MTQIFVEGTNSLRSFIARSVGPGSETPPQGYNDLTGDIRLEWNLEYRFDIAGNLKGALFIDAGNIWLFKDDASRPNGSFHFNTFINEIAITSGWGLRWDFSFIVARIDLGYTLRTPYLPQGERWVIISALSATDIAAMASDVFLIKSLRLVSMECQFNPSKSSYFKANAIYQPPGFAPLAPPTAIATYCFPATS